MGSITAVLRGYGVGDADPGHALRTIGGSG